jgi:hypothetical protein
LVSSCVLPLIKFIKKECPKKSGYLTELRDRKRRVVGPSRALGGFVSFVHGQPS